MHARGLSSAHKSVILSACIKLLLKFGQEFLAFMASTALKSENLSAPNSCKNIYLAACMFIPPKTVRVIYNVFIHGLTRRSRAGSRGLISQYPPLSSNTGSLRCSFRIWIGHCGLSVYRRYKHSDLFTLSPKVNHFHPNTLFSSSFIIHPKTNILHSKIIQLIDRT